MLNRRNPGIQLPDEVMAALTNLAGQWRVSTDEAAHRLLRDAIFQFDESLLPTDIPPMVKMANALMATAIDNGADELRLVPTSQEVEPWIRVDGHWKRVPWNLPIPLHLQWLLFERYERMARTHLARIVGVPEAPISIRHYDRPYTVTVGYVADEAASNGESLLLRITPGHQTKASD